MAMVRVSVFMIRNKVWPFFYENNRVMVGMATFSILVAMVFDQKLQCRKLQ